MMDHCYRGFPQQSVKGKVFDPFPWVSPGKEWKVVTHDCNVPYIGDCDRTRVRIRANDVVIDRRDKIGAPYRTHGSFRKNTLRKYHDGIVRNSGNSLMTIHTRQRLPGFPIEALLTGATELCSSMIATVNRK